jgi:hypothetical protein
MEIFFSTLSEDNIDVTKPIEAEAIKRIKNLLVFSTVNKLFCLILRITNKKNGRLKIAVS